MLTTVAPSGTVAARLIGAVLRAETTDRALSAETIFAARRGASAGPLAGAGAGAGPVRGAGAAVAVPCSAAVWGLAGALSWMARRAVLAPVLVGANLTSTVQRAPTPTVVPVQSSTPAAKSPASAPVRVVRAMTRSASPLFSTVIVRTAPAVPATWSSKVTLVGVTPTRGALAAALAGTDFSELLPAASTAWTR